MTNSKINPRSCLFIIKLLVVGVLSAHLSVYVTGVCPHGNSDQRESSSGRTDNFTEQMSEVLLNFSLQHFMN